MDFRLLVSFRRTFFQDSDHTSLNNCSVLDRAHITFYLTTLFCDALYVMVEVGYVDVPMSLEQVPAFLTSLDTLLIISKAFWSNCIVSTEKQEQNRRNTLATPSFKEMVSESRNRHRSCQLRF